MWDPKEIPEDVAEKLRADHRRLRIVRTGFGQDIALRPPTNPEYKRFRQQQNDRQKIEVSIPNLFTACCVWPSGKDLLALIDEYPGTPEECAEELFKLAGVTGEAVGKD